MSATFSPPAFSPPRIDRVGLLLLVWWILFADLAGAAGLGLRIKDAADGGAEIIAVMAGSLAASAGLAPGDRILEAQGREIRQAADFTALVKNTKGAGSLELRVSRDGWRRTVQLATGQTTPTALDAESPSTAPPKKQAAKDPCGHGRLGIQIRDSATQTGVEIVEVEPDGAAAGTLRRGDLILAIEGHQIPRVAALLTLIDATLPGQPLKFLVDRDQKKISLKLRTSALSEFECLLERGDLQLDASNWEEAGQLYSAALRLRPEHIAGWERMAQMLDKKGDLQGALTSEQRALTKVGEHAAIHARIGWYQQRLGMSEEARVSSERALRLDSKNAAAHSTLASLAIARLDWETAIRHLRKFLEQQPDAAAAWSDLGLSLSNAGRDEDALTAYQRALALEPEHAITWFNTGLNLRRLGQEQQAVTHLNRAAELDSQGDIGQMARQQLAPTAAGPVDTAKDGSASARSDGRRANVAVGDFQVKAAKANQQIGDGLREVFQTSLDQSGYFNVVERMRIQDIAAEQTLDHSQEASPSSAPPREKMDVADIMVYGVVSEFEPEAGGMAFSNFLPQMGLAVRQSTKFSEMAIDVRAVDVRTGRVLVAQRIPGTAQAYSAGVGVNLSAGGFSMPVGLNAYRNTPMELAIRDCIQKATYFVINQTPQEYFRH